MNGKVHTSTIYIIKVLKCCKSNFSFLKKPAFKKSFPLPRKKNQFFPTPKGKIHLFPCLLFYILFVGFSFFFQILQQKNKIFRKNKNNWEFVKKKLDAY
jgi:hypothetical protein